MKNTSNITKRGRMVQFPNPPKPKIAFVKELPVFGQMMLYYYDANGYKRGQLGIVIVGCNELGTDINA